MRKFSRHSTEKQRKTMPLAIATALLALAGAFSINAFAQPNGLPQSQVRNSAINVPCKNNDVVFFQYNASVVAKTTTKGDRVFQRTNIQLLDTISVNSNSGDVYEVDRYHENFHNRTSLSGPQSRTRSTFNFGLTDENGDNIAGQGEFVQEIDENGVVVLSEFSVSCEVS